MSDYIIRSLGLSPKKIILIELPTNADKHRHTHLGTLLCSEICRTTDVLMAENAYNSNNDYNTFCRNR